jgi:palmitoyl-protein thioesterase
MLPLTLLLPALLTPALAASDPIPLVIWHGLGDSTGNEGLQEVSKLAEATIPGIFVHMVQVGEDASADRTATFLGNVTEQVAKVCADISAHPILRTAPAINALGFSQGGQFLRGLVQRCDGLKVRNLVTFGSQHNGIAKYQLCGPSDWLCKGYIGLLKANTWGSWVQGHLVPAQYFRATDEQTGEPTDEYLANSNFLADVNNERPRKNGLYKDRLSALENLVLYVFSNDTTVIPKETGWFAQTNMSSGEVVQLREREIYKEDWIGLKALDDKGGLHFKTVEGGHMRLDEDVLVDVFKTWFGGGEDEDEDEATGQQEMIEL